MTLYIGDTAVSPVVGVPVPEKRYNVGIDNFLGNVDENGAYIVPTEPFTPDFSKVKSLPVYGLEYKFYKTKASGDLVFGIENLSAYSVMYHTFASCSGLTSVSFPALTTISGSAAMSNTFAFCGGLTSVSFPVLTTISITAALNYTFQSCSGLTSVSFPALTTISGSAAMSNTFASCSGLTSVSFPALTEAVATAFGSSSYSYIFYGCTALTEIHFRAAAQATIEAMTGYADKWGATNATIYFDL